MASLIDMLPNMAPFWVGTGGSSIFLALKGTYETYCERFPNCRICPEVVIPEPEPEIPHPSMGYFPLLILLSYFLLLAFTSMAIWARNAWVRAYRRPSLMIRKGRSTALIKPTNLQEYILSQSATIVIPVNQESYKALQRDAQLFRLLKQRFPDQFTGNQQSVLAKLDHVFGSPSQQGKRRQAARIAGMQAQIREAFYHAITAKVFGRWDLTSGLALFLPSILHLTGIDYAHPTISTPTHSTIPSHRERRRRPPSNLPSDRLICAPPSNAQMTSQHDLPIPAISSPIEVNISLPKAWPGTWIPRQGMKQIGWYNELDAEKGKQEQGYEERRIRASRDLQDLIDRHGKNHESASPLPGPSTAPASPAQGASTPAFSTPISPPTPASPPAPANQNDGENPQSSATQPPRPIPRRSPFAIPPSSQFGFQGKSLKDLRAFTPAGQDTPTDGCFPAACSSALTIFGAAGALFGSSPAQESAPAGAPGPNGRKAAPAKPTPPSFPTFPPPSPPIPATPSGHKAKPFVPPGPFKSKPRPYKGFKGSDPPASRTSSAPPTPFSGPHPPPSASSPPLGAASPLPPFSGTFNPPPKTRPTPPAQGSTSFPFAEKVGENTSFSFSSGGPSFVKTGKEGDGGRRRISQDPESTTSPAAQSGSFSPAKPDARSAEPPIFGDLKGFEYDHTQDVGEDEDVGEEKPAASEPEVTGNSSPDPGNVSSPAEHQQKPWGKKLTDAQKSSRYGRRSKRYATFREAKMRELGFHDEGHDTNAAEEAAGSDAAPPVTSGQQHPATPRLEPKAPEEDHVAPATGQASSDAGHGQDTEAPRDTEGADQIDPDNNVTGSPIPSTSDADALPEDREHRSEGDISPLPESKYTTHAQHPDDESQNDVSKNSNGDAAPPTAASPTNRREPSPDTSPASPPNNEPSEQSPGGNSQKDPPSEAEEDRTPRKAEDPNSEANSSLSHEEGDVEAPSGDESDAQNDGETEADRKKRERKEKKKRIKQNKRDKREAEEQKRKEEEEEKKKLQAEDAPTKGKGKRKGKK